MLNMKYSKDGMQLTEESESCKYVAYPDPAWQGVPRTPANAAVWGHPWTLGYGRTAGVKEGDTCTHDEAVAWLLSELQGAVDAVNHLVKVPLAQEEFDALVDLVFNIGVSAFAGSTLLRLLNEGDYEGACAEIDKWDHAHGKVLLGLLRRRQKETALFEKGMKETKED